MMSMLDEWKASVIRSVGSRVSGGSSSGVDLAVAGNEDGLADSDLSRVDIEVDALDVADGGLVLSS
jgi:hypothetical protein